MIDFNNKAIIKLMPIKVLEGESAVKDLLINEENVEFAFCSIRDKLVFTNKRIISINVQGITGKKIDYTSIPYSKIQAFSIESSGVFDLDAELDITISGLGTIKFEISKNAEIVKIGQKISEYILK